jgi:hypothetical protein
MILPAQEIELPPMVIEGTFELRQTPSVTDRFTLYLQAQIEARRSLEESVARAPLFNARFWSYIPGRLEAAQNDSSQFFLPNYLSADHRETERALRDSQQHSLFDKR